MGTQSDTVNVLLCFAIYIYIVYGSSILTLLVLHPFSLSPYFPSVSTPVSSRYTTGGGPLADPRVVQLTRPDPRQKQGTPPTTSLTQAHPQPASLHFMQPQQAGRFPMPPTGVLPPEPNQPPFFGARDSQPPPLMSPVAMVCVSCVQQYISISLMLQLLLVVHCVASQSYVLYV